MNVVIETGRLLLRTFTSDDAQLIYELNRDPEVIKYTQDPVKDIDHAKQILEQVIIPQYILYNHGRWAVHTKQDIDPIAIGFIGWCGLKFVPRVSNKYRHEIDLGYRFIKKAWGKGYATEAAYACIKYGFEKLNLQRIIGRAVPGNIASLNV